MKQKRICAIIRGTLLPLFNAECENLALKESELIKLALNNYLRGKGITQGTTTTTPQPR